MKPRETRDMPTANQAQAVLDSLMATNMPRFMTVNDLEPGAGLDIRKNTSGMLSICFERLEEKYKERRKEKLYESQTTRGKYNKVGKNTAIMAWHENGTHAPYAMIDLKDIEEDPLVLLVFEDGSSFFAGCYDRFSDTGIDIWPWRNADGDFFKDPARPSESVLRKILECGKERVLDVNSHPFIVDHLKAIGKTMMDPPACIALLVSPESKKPKWENTAREEIIMILAGFSHLALVSAGITAFPEIEIKSSSAGGFTKGQKRCSESRLKASLAFQGSFHDKTKSAKARKIYKQYDNESYFNGSAIARIHEDGPNFSNKSDDMAIANVMIMWFSRHIMEKFGSPVGWAYTYNDGDSIRSTGYDVVGVAEYIDLDTISSHIIMAGIKEARNFIRKENLLAEMNDFCDTIGMENPLFSTKCETT